MATVMARVIAAFSQTRPGSKSQIPQNHDNENRKSEFQGNRW